MNHYKITAYDIPDAWGKVLFKINECGTDFKVNVGSEVSNTKKLNLTLEIYHPEVRPLINDKAPLDNNYLYDYFLRYLWLTKEEAMDDSNYTYGDRLRKPINQIDEAINKYCNDIQNRQVTLTIRLPTDIINDEPPCLSLIDTEVIDNQMHLTCYFRSWDAYAGLPANIAGLQLFNEAFVNEINERGNLDIRTGKLIFHSKNCHIYSRQYPMIEQLFAGNTPRFINI